MEFGAHFIPYDNGLLKKYKRKEIAIIGDLAKFKANAKAKVEAKYTLQN